MPAYKEGVKIEKNMEIFRSQKIKIGLEISIPFSFLPFNVLLISMLCYSEYSEAGLTSMLSWVICSWIVGGATAPPAVLARLFLARAELESSLGFFTANGWS